MTAKEVVKSFYSLDLAKDHEAISYIHPDCLLHWNSSKGYMCSDYKMIKARIETLKKAFHSFNYRLSHLLEDHNTVTARYTIYVTTIEKPDEEEPLAHFITIWEVKDGQLYKGFEISQLTDENSQNLNSFSEINV